MFHNGLTPMGRGLHNVSYGTHIPLTNRESLYLLAWKWLAERCLQYRTNRAYRRLVRRLRGAA
jgi:hypothetical protein